MKINEILKYVPFPDIVKKTLYNLMLSCAHPILGDTSVFLIMLMLVVFKGNDDPLVIKINEQYWTMLRRLLTKRTKHRWEVECLLSSINNCMNTLTLMARPFIEH